MSRNAEGNHTSKQALTAAVGANSLVDPFKIGVSQYVKMSPAPSVATQGAKSLATSVQQQGP